MGYVIIGRMSPRAAKQTDGRLAARLAAIASLGAAAIHFAVVPTHWQEWIPSGLFFVAIALFQLIWALAALARPTSSTLAVGIAANVGSAVLWGVSRTVGAPFGPHAGEPELVQAAGLCALLLEVYVVMGAAWVWYRGRQAEPISGFAHAAVLLGAGAVIAAAATVGTASGLQHTDHAPAGADHENGPSIGHEGGHHDHPPAAELGHSPAGPAHVEVPPAATDPASETAGGHHHEG
jgi:hypothetical protein